MGRVRMVPYEPRIVTFKDWVDARTPGLVVYYRPEDGTPYWPPKGRKYHEDGSFTDPFPVAGLTFGPDLSE